MRTHKRLLGVCGLTACAVLAVAATGQPAVVTTRLGTGLPPRSPGEDLPQTWAAPVDEAPTIDGRLDEKAWTATRPAVLGMLERHRKTSPHTEARCLHQGGVLYIGVKLAEPAMEKLKRTATRRDGPAWGDDSVELFLQPRADRDYFQIVVSASGAIYDRRDRGEPSDWDSGAKAAVAVDQDGWSMEVAVPMAALDVGEPIPSRWRVNVYRNRYAGGKAENQAWSPTLSGDYDVPERFGYLLFTPESPWAHEEAMAGRQLGIAAEKLGEEEAVLQFDLSTLPKGTRIYRARLQCERGLIEGDDPRLLTNIEIYPLGAPFRKGSPPRAEARPLALVPPWYRSFDMTELVRGWVAGKPNHGVYVKTFPGWRMEKTYLDLMYEGEPANVPPQVSDLKAFHRAGQTFLTWKEIEDPVGRDEIRWGEMMAVIDNLDRVRRVRYCVFRSDKPITTANLGQAELIARVSPGSCWNFNGRNIEKGIDHVIATRYALDHHQWNPFAPATMDGEFGRECLMERLVIRRGDRPLDRGTGLYVHTAARPFGGGSSISHRWDGKAFYAVATMVDGVINGVISDKNATGAVDESEADPEPVLQKTFPKQPYFNYPETRYHYVHFVAPPFVNVPYQYYNWAVAVPLEPQKDPRTGRKPEGTPPPLELNLAMDARSCQRTPYRIEPDSIVLTPHDFPRDTWWYGYHESLGTLKSFAEGVVQPYTERRVLWFVDWAVRKWHVDRNRILITARGRPAGGAGPSSWGGATSGALHLAFRYPEVFNLCIPGYAASPDYADLVRNPGRDPYVARSLQAIFGNPQWACKTDTGKSVWEELDLVRRVKQLPAATDLPPVTLTGKKASQPVMEFMAALLERGHLVMANFNTWTGPKLIPLSAHGTWPPPMIRADVRKNLLLPAFGRSEADSLRGGAVFTLINLNYRWQAADIVDTPQRIEITVWCDRRPEKEKGTDVTLRRMQKFKAEPGKTYHWVIREQGEKPKPRSTDRGVEAPPAIEGDATVDQHGLLTLRNVRISEKPSRIIVTAK